MLEGWKERQGDYVFTANEPGEYRFCFDNEMSTISDKMVDFEIAVCPLSAKRLSSTPAGCSIFGPRE